MQTEPRETSPARLEGWVSPRITPSANEMVAVLVDRKDYESSVQTLPGDFEPFFIDLGRYDPVYDAWFVGVHEVVVHGWASLPPVPEQKRQKPTKAKSRNLGGRPRIYDVPAVRASDDVDFFFRSVVVPFAKNNSCSVESATTAMERSGSPESLRMNIGIDPAATGWRADLYRAYAAWVVSTFLRTDPCTHIEACKRLNSARLPRFRGVSPWTPQAVSDLVRVVQTL